MQRAWKPTHLGVPGRAMILAVSLSAIAAAGLSFEMWGSGRTVVGQPLISRINPNTADASLLMTLPNIGPARAAAIVEFRQQQKPGAVVFQRVEDLQAVKGIGPKMSEGLRPWLDFETRFATAEE
jgi:competence ComEA-like helix-hairpin-helix protein